MVLATIFGIIGFSIIIFILTRVVKMPETVVKTPELKRTEEIHNHDTSKSTANHKPSDILSRVHF